MFLMTAEIVVKTNSYRSPFIDRVNKACHLVNGKRVNSPYTIHDRESMHIHGVVAVQDMNEERNSQREINNVIPEEERIAMEKEQLNRLRMIVKPNDKGKFTNDNGVNPFLKLIYWSCISND